MLYPIQNVMNMKKEWRINLDELGNWLDLFDERLEVALKDGLAMIDHETETASREIEEDLIKTEEELYAIFKKERLNFIEAKRKFVNDRDQRKEELKKEIVSEMEIMKKDVIDKAKMKRDALALWAEK